MAIYHMSASFISRANGQSAVAAAAYRSTERLTDERTEQTHDYTRKEQALHTEIIAPEIAPTWAHDRNTLWNEAEKSETRKNSQTAKEYRVALPSELSLDKNISLVRDWVKEEFTSRGLVADVAIHPPGRNGDERNVHAHVLVTTRNIGQEGFEKKDREVNTKEALRGIRRSWETHVNQALEREGIETKISSKTLKEQGIDRPPTVHRGHSPRSAEHQRENRGRNLENENIDLTIERLERARKDLEEIKATEKEIEKLRTRDSGKVESKEQRLVTDYDKELEGMEAKIDPTSKAYQNREVEEKRQTEVQKQEMEHDLDMGR